MSLFQNSVVAKQLQSQDKTKLLTGWDAFKNHFHNPAIQENIRNSKEEQYQGEFLIDLFVNVLGYTKNPTPNFTLTTEYKNVKDSKKADGAILVPSTTLDSTSGLNPLSISIVKAVIELKGTNTTDLNKIEVQAFGYKNNQPDCVYVITSNFEKLRFYIDNATEHIEFNLFHLTEKEFELLYLCLAYENIANDVPKKLKEQSVSQEKDITKKLYTDYSLFKRELHQDLVKQNPQFDALELFQKSQKLLDRFLFIFFAEDRNLLPTNLIFRINKEWRQLQEMRMNISLYDRYKIYFNDLNKGAKVTLPAFSETVALQKEEHQIFAYNGGLFQPDEILDHIIIDDELLYKYTHKLSDYDFASEVDVNILGHIFENSLNEIDQLTNEAIASTKGLSPLPSTMGLSPLPSVNKRKKDGVFYTPKYITKYIVDNTVGKLCIDKKVELNIIEEDYNNNKGFKPLASKPITKKQLLEKLTIYRNWLLEITICDPACGSGAFLNQALDFLIQEHRYVDELQAKLFGDAFILSDVEKSILENNLYGVDLNEESVEIAKLSLWLRTAQPNRKLNDLNNNIKCGNSLIDDVAIAGDKAFNWQTTFPKIFKEKQKKPWHITTAIHDSRTSQRMIDYKVREKRAMGTIPEPQINYLTDNDEMVIVETVAILVKEQNLNILAFNVCKDHIHIILVCEEEEVNEIVRKIKGRTAREVNLNNGINPSINKGFKPLDKESTGEKSIPLWTQKFGCKEIVDENQLSNTIQYIKTNRAKHNLPDNSNKGFKPLVERIVCTHKHAFREEYKGGFDVIIGNPPYVQIFDTIIKTELEKKYEVFKRNNDLYSSFYELSINILNKNGILGFITPNSFVKGDYFKNLREFFVKFQINSIVDFNNYLVFEDANVFSAILILEKKAPTSKWVLKSDLNTVKGEIEIGNPIFIQENSILTKFTNCKNFEDYFLIKDVGFNYWSVGGEKKRGNSIGDRVLYKGVKQDEKDISYTKGSNFNKYSGIENENFLKHNYSSFLNDNDTFRFSESLLKISPKLIYRQTSSSLIATVDFDSNYCDKTVHIIVNREKVNINSKYLVTIFNSKLLNYFYKLSTEELGRAFAQVKTVNIKKLPFLLADNQQPFIEKADLMLTLNKEFQHLAQKFQRTIQREFFSTVTDMGLNKGFKPLVEIAVGKPIVNATLPKKLQDWHLLSYTEFIKELEKHKVKLSLSQKAEWEEYFIIEAQKVLEIKKQIETTDKAIDAMVYQLYGLSDEEIAIVENS